MAGIGLKKALEVATSTVKNPAVLAGFAVAGVIVTCVCAIKDAKSAEKDEELKAEKEELKAAKGAKLKAKKLWKVVKRLAKRYIRTALAVTVTVTCIVGSHIANSRKIAAMSAAYKITENLLLDHKTAMEEVLEPEKVKEIHEKISENREKRTGVSDQVVNVFPDDKYWFFDPYCGRDFESTMTKVQEAVNTCNDRMIKGDMYCTLSDLYSEIDSVALPPTNLTEMVGWNVDKLIELRPYPDINKYNKPCVVIDFLKGPSEKYNHMI